MKPTLYPVLSNRNAHFRDQYIKFEEEGHKYTILNDSTVLGKSKYTSVTTWNHTHFPHFDADLIISRILNSKSWKPGHKYWGLTAQEIKDQWSNNSAAVSKAGTDLHYEIECFMNNKNIDTFYDHTDLYEKYILNQTFLETDKSLEWNYFINFVKDHSHLKPYRTEWTIFDEELKIAGSIDMIYENSDGTLSIYDWKRSKEISMVNHFNKFAKNKIICHMPDSNFWHYALQLNTYKAIIERKYGKKVRDLYLVRLHPDAEENNYDLIKLPDLSMEIKELFEERIKEVNNENA